MTTIEKYIDKLDSVFVAPTVDYQNDHDTLVQGDWAFQLHTKIDSSDLHVDDLPVQVIARITYKGVQVSFYGAENHKDNKALYKWWATHRAKALDRALQQRRAVEKEGKTLWASK